MNDTEHRAASLRQLSNFTWYFVPEHGRWTRVALSPLSDADARPVRGSWVSCVKFTVDQTTSWVELSWSSCGWPAVYGVFYDWT